MVELLGTCRTESECCHVDVEVSTYHHVESICELEVSRKLKPYRKLRDEKRAYTGNSRYLCLSISHEKNVTCQRRGPQME